MCSVNEHFFEKWSSDMAYILGFFAADGCLTKNSKRRNYYLEFVSTDLDILQKIKRVMMADQGVTKKIRSTNLSLVKQGYRIQIGSKKLFIDLISLGMVSNKSKTLKLTKIPDPYFSDFVRGFFDGDGYSNYCVYYARDRAKMRTTLLSGFACGSRNFLEGLKGNLNRLACLEGGSISSHNNNFALAYSVRDTRKLFNYMYNDLSRNIFLERKYFKFRSDIDKYGSVA